MSSVKNLTRVLVVGSVMMGYGSLGVCADNAAEPAPEYALAKVTPEEALAVDALLMTVNGEPIYAKDVVRQLDADFRKLALQMAQEKKPLREFKAAVTMLLDQQLRDSVRNILLYSAAKDALSEEELGRIDVVMNQEEKRILSRYQGSRALADAQLRAQGTSLDRELTFRRRQMTVGFYQHKVLLPKINVRRQMVVEEYEENLKKYTIVPEVDLSVIRIDVIGFLPKLAAGRKPTPEQIKDAESKAWALAREVYGRLKQGADFAKEAEANSNDSNAKKLGGRYPHQKTGSWTWDGVEQRAFAAQSNTLIEPFASPDPTGDPCGAVFVLKVGEVIKGRVKSFDEVQDEIYKNLMADQERVLDKELTHKLFEKSAIDKKDDSREVLETLTRVVIAKYAVKSAD